MFLRLKNMSPRDRVRCPQCKTEFEAQYGFPFFCEYTNAATQERHRGDILFCSTKCALEWPSLSQMGKAQ